MRDPLTILLALIACGAGPATSPSTAPTVQQTLSQLRDIAKAEYTAKTNDAPLIAGRRAIQDLFTLAIDKEGALIVRPKIGKTQRSRVSLTGIPGPSVISIVADKDDTPEGTQVVQFETNDFEHGDDVYRLTQLFTTAASTQLSATTESLRGSVSVQLIQSYATDEPDSAARLYVQVFSPADDELQTKLNLPASSFVELRRRYPREARQYLDPMIRDLQQASEILAPDARVGSQVFAPDTKPDAELSRKIDQALAMFDAEDFKVRRNASKALAELGSPAALALTHADRKGWSIERSNGVDAFLAQFEGQQPADVEKLKSDPAFLLDCLYSDDAVTRSGAAIALEKILRKPVTIEPNADSRSRAAAIDRIYPLLLKQSTNPATRP